MALTAKLLRDDRRADREALDVAGTLRHLRNVPIDVVIEDLSATGFRMRTRADLSLQERVMIGIPGIGQRAAYVVRHAAGCFGCEFVEAIDPRLVAMPSTVQSVVEANFGGQLDTALVREWSLVNPPQIERLSQVHRLLIVSGLGIAGWLALLGAVSLF